MKRERDHFPTHSPINLSPNRIQRLGRLISAEGHFENSSLIKTSTAIYNHSARRSPVSLTYPYIMMTHWELNGGPLACGHG